MAATAEGRPHPIYSRKARATADEAFGLACARGPVLVDDVIINEIAVRLSWPDRLRALLGRPLHVHVSTPVRVPPPGVAMPGDPESLYILPGRAESRAWVDPIFRRSVRMVADAR